MAHIVQYRIMALTALVLAQATRRTCLTEHLITLQDGSACARCRACKSSTEIATKTDAEQEPFETFVAHLNETSKNGQMPKAGTTS